MPRFSIIIPTYNSVKTLQPLLASLAAQRCRDFEAIVVDDASTDDTERMVRDFDVRYERHTANQGPAVARNRGAALAQGEWLIFTDADTEWRPDTLERIEAILARSDADAIVGSYTGTPANPGFAPRYKALWEFVIIDRCVDENDPALFPMDAWSPRPGVVRRAAFEQVGGFNAGFRGADLEDVEFGYRLHDAGCRIYLAPSVKIRHHYPATILRELKPFARRAALWMRMGSKRRKTDSHGEASPRIAAAHLAGFGSFGLLILGVLFPPVLAAAALGLIAYAVLIGPFLAAALRREGPGFCVLAGLYCWVHSIVLGLAAGYGLATSRRRVT